MMYVDVTQALEIETVHMGVITVAAPDGIFLDAPGIEIRNVTNGESRLVPWGEIICVKQPPTPPGGLAGPVAPEVAAAEPEEEAPRAEEHQDDGQADRPADGV